MCLSTVMKFVLQAWDNKGIANMYNTYIAYKRWTNIEVFIHEYLSTAASLLKAVFGWPVQF